MKWQQTFSYHLLGAFLILIGDASRLEAQTPIQFTNIQRLANMETTLTIRTPTNGNYDLLVSSNLIQWSPLLTTLSTSTSLQHTDSATPFLPVRYYKAELLTNSNAVTGDHVPTEAGDLVIHKGWHASFAMSWNGLMIYVDPTNTFPSLPRANLFLLTHDHGDHYNTTVLGAVRGPNAIFVVPGSIYVKANFATFTSSAVVLSNGFSTTQLGIQIEAIPMYNANHPKGAGNGYVLTLGGKRIYISGDTVDNPETLALRNIDLAFLAMNQPYTLTVSQAVNVVRSVVPRIVYPEHYKGNPPTDLNSFKQQVLTNPGVEVRLRNWY